MAERNVRKLPDPVLRQQALPVTRFGAYLDKLLDDMLETMYATDGVGLAAPQIGISKRLVVIDVGEGPIYLVNPKIIESEGEAWAIEGCLSIPEKIGKVKRAQRVVVEALNPQQELIQVEGEGLLARAFQHEIDHLDGCLFIDRATELYDNYPDEDQEDTTLGEA